MGVNAIQTYAMWSLHEPFRPGAFDFSGPLDLEAFLDAAAAEGLWVLLRPGPYVCAEVDAGGLPWWLHDPSVPGAGPEMKPRTADPDFLGFVDAWWGKLLPMMRPRLAANGGNVLMVQMENEYGSFNSEFLSFFLYFWERDRERWGRGLEGRERKRERERESERKKQRPTTEERERKKNSKKLLQNSFLRHRQRGRVPPPPHLHGTHAPRRRRALLHHGPARGGQARVAPWEGGFDARRLW